MKELLYESQRNLEGELIVDVYGESGERTIMTTLQDKNNKKAKNKYLVVKESKLNLLSTTSLTDKQYKMGIIKFLKRK